VLSITQFIYALSSKEVKSVAYLGYGRHGTCHGRHFDGGAKIAWKKFRSLCTVSWTSISRPMPGRNKVRWRPEQ